MPFQPLAAHPRGEPLLAQKTCEMKSFAGTQAVHRLRLTCARASHAGACHAPAAGRVVQLVARQLSSVALGQHESSIDIHGGRCAAGRKASQSAQRVCSEVDCGLFRSVSAEWSCARAQSTSGGPLKPAITTEYSTCGSGSLRGWAVMGSKCLLARRSMVTGATSDVSHTLDSHGLATTRGTF